MPHNTLLVLFLTFAQFASAQSGLDVVKAYYKQALSGVQEAKTKEDLTKLVETLDAPDWVSINPTGLVAATRAQTPAALEPLLAIEPGKRPRSTVEILWVHEEPGRITAVSIILSPESTLPSPPQAVSKSTFGSDNQPHFLLAGILIRDTFARTAEGWRRIKHEILLPYEFNVPSEESVVSAL
jgi:hypothetical protein